MHLTAETSTDRVREQLLLLGDLPGVLWSPDGATGTRPLILIGHGGGRHKRAPEVLVCAHRFVRDGGFAVASRQCDAIAGHGGVMHGISVEGERTIGAPAVAS